MSWLDRGFETFPPEPAVEDWLREAGPAALAAAAEPGLRRRWLRHGETWFVGVGVLGNDAEGRVAGGTPLAGAARAAAEAVTGRLALHPAQVSVTYPGYPGRDPDESEAAHRYRRTRDAAHLDGLLPVGAEKRRFLKEVHGYILGIAVTGADPGAAPLVVREGSHRLIRAAFAEALAGADPARWSDIDLTEVYQAARREVFARCPRVELPLRPGQSVLLHRHAIHGVAPWAEGAGAAPEGRAIVYLRPELPQRADWLSLP
ncbi:MAG: hypothetical protein ACOCY0_03530 [Roseicyclus sp.]